MVPELARYIQRTSINDAIDVIVRNKLIEEEGSLSVFYLIRSRTGTHQKTLQDLLDLYHFTSEGAKALAEEAHNQGITSTLSEEVPYLVVLDNDKFDQFVAEKARQLEEKILNASSAKAVRSVLRLV